MSPLTYWHTLFLTVIGLIFIIGAILALRSDSRWSILTSISVIMALIGIYGWSLINQNVYSVELSHIDDHRIYQTEQIVITGVVRNIGEFPVSNVKAIVRLVNTGGGKSQKASQFAQPTAFAEILGDDPSFKPQNITTEHIIADNLNPGHSKSFRIYLDYPTYFKNGNYEIEAKAD